MVENKICLNQKNVNHICCFHQTEINWAKHNWSTNLLSAWDSLHWSDCTKVGACSFCILAKWQVVRGLASIFFSNIYDFIFIDLSNFNKTAQARSYLVIDVYMATVFDCPHTPCTYNLWYAIILIFSNRLQTYANVQLNACKIVQ